jgi:SAM-dependent methyltransferase
VEQVLFRGMWPDGQKSPRSSGSTHRLSFSPRRELSAGIPRLRFQEGDARNLPYAEGTFDVVLFHTTLSHVPTPERALVEAFRVLRPNGYIVIFDGDFANATVAIGDHDPLQACIEADFVHDRWLMRRIQGLAESVGFQIVRFDSHGYIQTTAPDYMIMQVDRGADVLGAAKCIDVELAEALKQAARRRAARGEFFGSIMCVSLIAKSRHDQPARRQECMNAPPR